MTTIGFIGSGNIGSTIAKLAIDAGHDVVLANSRGPETLEDLVTKLGPNARAATADEAAAAGEIVVVTIPFGPYEQVQAEPLAGKVVIDTCNYYPDRDGHVAALDDKQATSSGLVQEHLAQSHVVKAFNNIFFEHLGSLHRPAGAADRATLLIAGDDADAKATATAFIDSLGYDVYDTGPLAESWRFEPDHTAYAPAYAEGGDFSKPLASKQDRLIGLLAQAQR